MERREAQGGTLILGGGFAGSYVARFVGKRRATIVALENYMLYTPLLPEAGAGTIEPRHVVVPLRQMCPHAELLLGRVTGLDEGRRVVLAKTLAGPYEIGYERLVVALGAVTRVLPVPGLAEHGVGFKDLADAIALRNRVLQQLERASIRTGAVDELGFVFVGAGYAGSRRLPSCRTSPRRRRASTPRFATYRSGGSSSTLRRRSSPRSPAGWASTPRSTSRDTGSRSTSRRRSRPTTAERRSSPTGHRFLRGRSSGRPACVRTRSSASSAYRSRRRGGFASTSCFESRDGRTSGRSETARPSRTRRPRATSTHRPASTHSDRHGGSRRISRASRSRTATGCSARWRRSATTRASPRSRCAPPRLPRLVRRPDVPPLPTTAPLPEAARRRRLDRRALLPPRHRRALRARPPAATRRLMDVAPLYSLRLRTPRLELRLGSRVELFELGRLAERGIHPPDRMPFFVAWTDRTGQPDFLEQFVAFHDRAVENWSPGEWTLNLLVWEQDALVGTQSVGAESFAEGRRVGTGSWLGAEHQRRGLGTEMRAAVLELAFAGLGASAAASGWLEGNDGSRRVSEKLGYVQVGRETASPRGIPVVQHNVEIECGSWVCPIPVELGGLDGCRPLFGI